MNTLYYNMHNEFDYCVAFTPTFSAELLWTQSCSEAHSFVLHEQ